MKKEIKTYTFVIILCSVSALILSTISTALAPIQVKARDSYRNKELLKAADLLPENASNRQVQEITAKKVTPMLTNNAGDAFTFEEKNINYSAYLEEHAKEGFGDLPLKLFFKLHDGGVILPINGFGLWDAIYGYIGIEKNGYAIIGISWYDQKETPGLGAEIQNPSWQEGFKGKHLFHGTKMNTFGLQFVPKEMLKLLPPSKKEYNIDAISGATITSLGVQNAIKNSLSPYIPLLRKMQKR